MQSALRLTLLAAMWAAAAPLLAAEPASAPAIGPAPAFALTDQDGQRVDSADLAGRVLVVDFIFTSCADSCPVQTEKLSRLRAALGADFGTRVRFVSISVDPEHDTPAALARYAERHHARVAGWSFLTGPPAALQRIARAFGVVTPLRESSRIVHNTLTTLVDGRGTMRIQYAGTGYRIDEMRSDILALAGARP